MRRMNRRPSYASVAAGSINRSRLAYSGTINTGDGSDGNSNSNPLSPVFGEIHPGDPAPHLSSPNTSEQPIVRLANMQQPPQTSRGGHEGPSVPDDGPVPNRPSEFGLDWDEMERKDNLALYGRHTTMGPGDDRFIMPGYLVNSRYMRKLVDRQDARDAARRERDTANGYQSHRPSRSPSSTNLASHKIVPSHRGMTYDLIEARPPESHPEVAPLPSRWNEGELDVIGDGTVLRWPSTGSKSDTPLSAQTDHPMPPDCGIYYFEVHINQCAKGSGVAVGITSSKHDSKKLPGWEPHSWGWHGDEGTKHYPDHSDGVVYDKQFGKNDTIGCGVDFVSGKIFFTRNGHRLEDAFRDVSERRLYPTVGFKLPGVSVSTNFGQVAFQYNIADEVRQARQSVKAEALKLPEDASLLGGRTYDTFVKEMVAQFLRHGGYVETAKAFTNEVQTEHAALGEETPISGNAAVEDIDAAQRQRIRSAILVGDVDKATQCTQDFYPEVLDANPIISFRLKAMRFLEIVRAVTSSSRQNPVPVSPLKKQKAKATLPGASLSNLSASAMDLDNDGDRRDANAPSSLPPTTTVTPSITWPTDISGDDDDDDHMETSNGNIAAGIANEDGPAAPAAPEALWQLTGNTGTDLQTAISEGQKLSEEYDRDQRREIKEVMRHIKGIWAYDDPTRAKEVGYLFRQEERVKVAEELNGAILVSMGKSSVAAIERLAQQTEVLVEEITEQGLPGALINLERDLA